MATKARAADHVLTELMTDPAISTARAIMIESADRFSKADGTLKAASKAAKEKLNIDRLRVERLTSLAVWLEAVDPHADAGAIKRSLIETARFGSEGTLKNHCMWARAIVRNNPGTANAVALADAMAALDLETVAAIAGHFCPKDAKTEAANRIRIAARKGVAAGMTPAAIGKLAADTAKTAVKAAAAKEAAKVVAKAAKAAKKAA